MINRLQESLAAVCPIVGVSVPTEGTSVGVRIDFDPSATAQQQTDANAVLAAFDWSQSAHDAWLLGKLRALAKSDFESNHDSIWKLLRCFADVVKDQLNLLGEVIGTATATWNPASMSTGTGVTSPGVTVTGAAIGDVVDVHPPYTPAGVVVYGFVSAADTVNVRLQNGTGSTVDLASGDWSVVVRRYPGTRTLGGLRTAIENRIDGGTLD